MTARLRWERTADRSVWAAAAPGGVQITVTRTSGGGRWLPAVAGVSGPERRTRLEAQAWCERQVTP